MYYKTIDLVTDLHKAFQSVQGCNIYNIYTGNV